MKTLKSLSSVLILLTLTFSFTFCSKDNNPDETPAAKEIAGEYTNIMNVNVMGNKSIFSDVTFTLTAISDNKVRISVSEFGEDPMAIPAMDICEAKVVGKDGNYVIEETAFENVNSANKKYSGTLAGNYTSNKLNLNINLTYGAMPMPMICTFSSPKN